MNRRQFLATGSAGLASVALPRFLGAAPNATDLTQPTPANPFLEWFGIDETLIRRAMSELTANGADIAELYFQHKRTNLIRMQDGLASQASSDIAQGVGLRVVVAGQTGYAFTEDLTPCGPPALPRPSQAARGRPSRCISTPGVRAISIRSSAPGPRSGSTRSCR